MPGFTENSVKKYAGRELKVGYGREIILENAEKVCHAHYENWPM